MALPIVSELPPLVDLGDAEAAASARIDQIRLAMEAEMAAVQARCKVYLNWYSPPYEPRLLTHDAWQDPFLARSVDTTRANFPIARAVVDIWSALEASKPATLWAEPERIPPPPPTLDQATAISNRLVAAAFKQANAVRSTLRARTVRDWMRRDNYALKQFVATRRKNLYGFSWQKVWPHPTERRPVSHVLRNPTTVFPIWSSAEPGELEAVLVAYQKNINRANAEYGLGIPIKSGQLAMGADAGIYRNLDERWYDSTRTMLWVEEFWWREQRFDRDGFVAESVVKCIVRVANRIVRAKVYPGWRLLPWVYWENTDERDAFGWSDIASVIDINDEINRRISEEGDVIHMYSAPRFQLLNSFAGRDVEMPGPFELISLQDQERIEQVLARIDAYPTQQHFNILLDLLHRVSGLPPITWGLIQNAQTSGRALSASWKATEARLAPKLLRNERSYDDYLALVLQYAELYNWRGAKELYRGDDDNERFRDFRWEFPPMEPRDFLEVIQGEITKRDAKLTTTLKAIRATGDEAAEDTWEEVQAEALNIFAHPDNVQAFLLAQRAELDNIAFAQQLGVEIGEEGVNPGTVASAVGEARQGASANAQPAVAPEGGTLPPTQAGAPANAGQAPGAAPGAPGSTLTSGTLVRGGEVSNQFLETRRY